MGRYVVRYGATRALGIFTTRANDRIARTAKVIARTHRGLEAADVLCEATDEVAQRLSDAPGGQILRELSPDDANELVHLHARERKEFETCQQHVVRLKLQMQLIDIEHLFGGERIVVYYLSEDRVDFRDLVKALASEFQTRIEMRQIGVRDEAKLLADYGDCGKPLCCNTHLAEMPPVSMKMAKVQKATLDPTKISGRCGRLKCCLRYEYDTYEELMKDMPPVGSEVVTANGRARVLAQEILAQQLLVQMEDGRRILIGVAEVMTVLKTGTGKRSREPFGDQAPREGGRDSGRREPRNDQRSNDRGGRPPAPGENAPGGDAATAVDAGSETAAPQPEQRSNEPRSREPRGNEPRGRDQRGDRGPRQQGPREQRPREQREPRPQEPQRDGDVAAPIAANVPSPEPAASASEVAPPAAPVAPPARSFGAGIIDDVSSQPATPPAAAKPTETPPSPPEITPPETTP